MSRSFGDKRVLPYLQLHEFEALLYVALSVLARCFPRLSCKDSIDRLAQDVAAFENPEMINDRPEGAPSRRLIASIPAYRDRKVDVGVAVAEKIGLTALRQRCPHFAEWIGKL